MLDRSLQKSLLEQLASAYPERTKVLPPNDPDENTKIANLLYLEEHELIDAGLKQNLSGAFNYMGSKIKAKGLDFLADDGGLTAVLGTVTVKLHADTVRELLASKIAGSTLPAEEKGRLMKKLETVSSEALKAITKKLVEKGVDSLPEAAQWLQTVLA